MSFGTLTKTEASTMEWVLSLCLLYAKHSKSTSAKAVPLGNNKHKQNLQIKNSLSLGGEMSRRDREGRLSLKPRLPHNQRTYPSDCKAGAREKAVPLGGRWELSLKFRLPHNQRTYHNHANKPHQTRKAIQPRKRAPPHRALTGPPPTQRGRLKYSRKASANIQSNHYS